MKLNINKRILKAGEVIEVSWDAEDSSSPRLVMHTGQRETTLAVPQSGSKKFRLKGGSFSHWIGLKAYVGNQEKLIKRRVFFFGKSQQTDHFEYMDGRQGFISRWRDGIKRWWNFFPTEKKRLYIILLALLAYQILLSFGLFVICHLLLTAIIFYLFWQIIKR